MQQTLQVWQVAQPSVLSQAEAAVKSLKRQVVAWAKAHQEQLECYVGGPIVVAFCFALYYLASVLEGGAA